MTLVVDASVALKWVLEEAGTDRAEAVIGAEPLLAPDFLMLECANVLAQQVRRRALSGAQASAGVRRIGAAGVRQVASAPLVAEAERLAVALGASVYDTLYLAVALSNDARLLTADIRFAARVDGDCRSVVQRL